MEGEVPRCAPRWCMRRRRRAASSRPTASASSCAASSRSTTGGTDQRLSIMPFAGGSETPFPGQGSPTHGLLDRLGDDAHDDARPRAACTSPSSTSRNGSQLRATDIPDSIIAAVAPLADGFAWVPAARDKRRAPERDKGTTEIPRPASFAAIRDLAVSPDGKQIALLGWNMGTSDSVVIALVPTDGGPPVLWFSRFAEGGAIDLRHRWQPGPRTLADSRVDRDVPAEGTGAGGEDRRPFRGRWSRSRGRGI